MSDKDPYGQPFYGTQPTGPGQGPGAVPGPGPAPGYPPGYAPGVPPGMPPLATHGQRFLARLIDTVPLIVLWVIVSVVVFAGNWSDAGGIGFGRQLLVYVIVYGVYFVYEGVMVSRTGQTLGKMALKIRVARLADGNAPGNDGWQRAAVYVLPGILSAICIGAVFWLLNVLWCTWDKPYQQCLHDKAAKTVVVQAG
ncbi:RDD family protein [Streptomyces sp. NPDC059373]